MQPARIGPYVVDRELGRGGMGVVLAGRAPDGRPVALKLLLGQRPDAVQRFAREARLQASLGEAEGFVPLLDAGVTTSGEPYLVLPLLTGGTLRDRLRRGPLEVEAAARLVLTLSTALASAHARGLVHRDLKPENVLFTADGRPLVADLGLAKHWDGAAVGASRSVALTRSGELRGTLGYMAPEQIDDAKHVGPPADVFALGAMLYELLCGASPIEGESLHNRMVRTMQGDFPPLGPRRPDAPAWLVQLVHRALAVDPAGRPADGGALATLLAAGLSPRGRRRARSRRPLVLALAGVALLAATAGGLVFGVWRQRPPGAADPAPVPTRAAPAPRPPAHRDLPAIVARIVRTGGLRVTDALGCAAGVHAEAARSARFVPGGALVVTGADDGRVVVRERATGEVVRRLEGLGAQVCALAASPDGELVAGADSAGRVVAWKLSSGRQVWQDEGPQQSALSLAFSGDGKHVLWVGATPHLKAAEARTGERVELLRAELPLEQPMAIASLPGAGLDVVVAGVQAPVRITRKDGPAQVVRADDGGQPTDPSLSAAGVAALGRTAALAVGVDGQLTRWSLGGVPARVERVPAHTRGLCVAASPDGQRWASGGDEGRLLVGRSDALLERVEHVEPDCQLLGVDVDDRGDVLAAGSDGVVRLWTLDDGALRRGWPEVPLRGLTALCPLPDGALLATTLTGVARVDEAGARPAFAGHGRQVTGVALVTPDAGGLRAVSVGNDGFARLWRVADGAELDRVALAAPGVRYGAAFVTALGDGRRALVATREPRAFVWDLAGGGLTVELAQARAPLRSVAAAGELALASDDEGGLLVWDLAAPDRPPRAIAAHRAGCFVTAGPGARALTVADDGTLAVWDLAAPEPAARRSALALRGAVHAAALSPDGGRALVATNEGQVVLCDVARAAERGRLELDALDHWSRALAWAPDGRSARVGTIRGLVLEVAVEAP